MDSLLIDSTFLSVGKMLASSIVLLGVITILLSSESAFAEWCFSFCKAFFYLLLCLTIWKAYPYFYDMGKIGAILAMTFVVSCLEIGENTLKLLKKPIVKIKSWISLKKRNENSSEKF